MTVKAFLSADDPVYQPSDTDDCPPDCPIAKLIQLDLLDPPHKCDKCGATVVASENVE